MKMSAVHKDTKTAACYVIRVKGHLSEQRSTWFEGMAVVTMPDGFTQISGQVPDQAAVFGLLSRVRDLGLELWKVERRIS